MSDFDSCKYQYLIGKRKNQILVNNLLLRIAIPEVTTNEITRIVNNPKNDDELSVGLSFLELCKRIENNTELLSDVNSVNPFNSVAYEYISKSIRIQIDMICNLVKNAELDITGNSLEYDLYIDLRNLAKEMTNNNKEEYMKLLVELSLYIIFMKDEITNKIIEKEYGIEILDEMKTEEGKEMVIEYYDSALSYFQEACYALFVSLDDKLINKTVDCKEIVTFLDTYKDYITSMSNERKK